MSVNRLQGFPAGELSFAALSAQLPVAVAGQAGITIPVLYDNLLSDPGADMPFAGPEGAFFVQALTGAVASAAIGPGPNAPVHAVCFNRGSGPVVVAIACRDPLMGMLVGTGKALPGNAANQLGIASAAGAATAHALIQGCFALLTSFVQTAAATYAGRDLVLTGHGTGGYFALALRCLLPGQIARAYAFDAPAHGLRTAFPPAGGDVDDRVLEVRAISADSVHQMEPALGRRLLVDAATFGYQVSGPLKDGPGRGTLLDRTLRRLAADPRPEPLLGPLLSVTGGMPGQQPAVPSHPCHDLLRLLGGHLAQVGQAGAVLRLAMHHDGSVRIDIPGTVAGQSASPARGLRFGSDGTMAIGGVPGGTLHVAGGLTWGDGVGTVLTILPWDGGNYASEVPIDPLTGLIAGEAGTVSVATLLNSIFGSGAQVSLPPIVDAETQITQSWRQRDAWIDPALSIDQTPDLLPLLAGGLPSAAGTLMGMVSMGAARPDAAEAVHGVIRDVVHHVGGYLDALFGTMSGPYQHSKLLWSADLPSLSEVQRERRPGHVAGYIALHTVTFLLRGLTTPGAAILSPASLGDLVGGAAGRFLAGRLGVGPVVSDVAAWQQALTETKTAGADVSLSEVWRLPDPINIRPETLPVLLATTDLTARPTVGLLLLTALAEATGLSAPPSGAQATVIRAFNGQKQNLGVTASRSGYEGPLERLAIRAAAVADIPHALVNTITGGLGVHQNGVPPVTLAHQPSSDLFALLGTTPDQTGLAPAVAMTRQAAFLLAAAPGGSDPVITALLRRGWVDWLLLAQEAVFRQSLPRQPELYSWFDILIATQSNLGLTPAIRPERGTDAFVMVGLLAELNRVATTLVASGGNPAAMADAFLNLVDGLSPLAASMHIPAHTLPVLPPAPATILERLSFWLDETAGLTEPVLRGAIETNNAPLLPPTGITVTSLAPVQTDGTQVPGIEVKWNLVGPGQHILIRWRERDAADWQITSVTLAVSTYVIRPILAGKSYDIELARSNGTQQSPWVSAISKGAKTGLENASVVGLHLTGLDNATEWVGRDVSINWRGAYPNAVIDPTTGMAITPTAYMDGYVVKVFDGASKHLLRQTQPSMQTDYTYSYESNDTDTARLLLSGPTRSLHFEVFIVPKSGQAIGKAELKVTNPAPAKVVVAARTGLGSLQVSVTPVSDRDLSRYLLWISDQPGFDPATTELIDIGATTEYSQPLLKVGPCYVRAAAVDLFQPKNGLDLANLNISDEVVVELVDITIDKTPPAVPTGLVLDSTLVFTPGGEQIVTLTATWDRSTEEDFLTYEGQIRLGGEEPGDWSDFSLGLPAVGNPRFSQTVLPNTAYDMRIRAVDRSANRSDYCAIVNTVSDLDTNPPNPITGASATASFKLVSLHWTNPADYDFSHVEIHAKNEAAFNLAPGPDGAILLGTSTVNSFIHATLGTGAKTYYWLRAVDTSGNHSVWNSNNPPLSGTPLGTGADDVDISRRPDTPPAPEGAIEREMRDDGTIVHHLNLILVGYSPDEDQGVAYLEWSIKPAGLPAFLQQAGGNTLDAIVRSATAHEVKVRAVNRLGVASIWSQSIVVESVDYDDGAPDPVTNVSVVASFRGVQLRWTPPGDADWWGVDIWGAKGVEATATDRQLLASVSADNWTHSGVVSGDTWRYWLRSYDASGNRSDIFTETDTVIVDRIGQFDIDVDAVRAEHIRAGSISVDMLSVGDGAVSGFIEFRPRRQPDDTLVTASPYPLSWRDGTIEYQDGGLNRLIDVPAGTTSLSGYLLFDKDSLALLPGAAASAITGRRVVIGHWNRDVGEWRRHVPKTLIDGNQIITGSITADHIKAGSIDTSKLKVAGRILKIEGLTPTFTDGLLQWSGGRIDWTGSDGAPHFVMITANAHKVGSTTAPTPIPVGNRIRLYWMLGESFLRTTADISINPPADAVVLATVRPSLTPLADPEPEVIVHYSDAVITGNRMTIGGLHANMIKGDLIDAKEIRVGPTFDGQPGLYLRAKDGVGDGPGGVGGEENQKALFAFAGGYDAAGNFVYRRRAQMYVSANGDDGGFVSWDRFGNKIFDSNGLGTGTVGTSALRPESATFVRAWSGTLKSATPRVIVNIQGLAPTEEATIVMLAFSNGDYKAKTHPTIHPNTSIADSYRMKVVEEILNNSNGIVSESVVGGVWLDGHVLMNFHDSKKYGNGRYGFRIQYNLVDDVPGNPDLPPASYYDPFTSLTIIVAMR